MSKTVWGRVMEYDGGKIVFAIFELSDCEFIVSKQVFPDGENAFNPDQTTCRTRERADEVESELWHATMRAKDGNCP